MSIAGEFGFFEDSNWSSIAVSHAPSSRTVINYHASAQAQTIVPGLGPFTKKLKRSSDDVSELHPLTYPQPSTASSNAPSVSQDQPPEPDFILRCFMKGAPGVGKSTLFNYFRKLASKMQPFETSSDIEPVVVGPIPFPMGNRMYYIAFEFFDQSHLKRTLKFTDKHLPIYLACFNCADIKTFRNVNKARFQKPGQTVVLGLQSDLKTWDENLIRACRVVADKIEKRGLTYIECSGKNPYSLPRIELILGYSFLFARGINVAIQGPKGVGKTSFASRLGAPSVQNQEAGKPGEADHSAGHPRRCRKTFRWNKIVLPTEFLIWDMPKKDYLCEPDCIIHCIDLENQNPWISEYPSGPFLLAGLKGDNCQYVYVERNLVSKYSEGISRCQRYMELSAKIDIDFNQVFAAVISFLRNPGGNHLPRNLPGETIQLLHKGVEKYDDIRMFKSGSLCYEDAYDLSNIS